MTEAESPPRALLASHPTTPSAKTPAVLRTQGQTWLLDVQDPRAFVRDCPPAKHRHIWVKLLRSFHDLFKPPEEGGGLVSAHVELQAVSACRILKQYASTEDRMDADVEAAAAVVHENLLLLFDYPELQSAIADALLALIQAECVAQTHVLGKLLLWTMYSCTAPKIPPTALRCIQGTCSFLSQVDWSTADDFKRYCEELAVNYAFLTHTESRPVMVALFSQDSSVTRWLHKAILPSLIAENKKEVVLGERQRCVVDMLIHVWETLTDLHLHVFEHEVIKAYANMALRAQPSVFASFKVVLETFAHSKTATTRKVRDGLRRILRKETDILAFLDAPNAMMRSNSIALLGFHFPLCMPHTLKAEMEAVRVAQFNIIVRALTDRVPTVRARAVDALCEVITRHWDVIPKDMIVSALVKQIFSPTHGLLYDKTDASVRCAVLSNVKRLLANSLLHELTKKLLTGLKHLNDPSAKVRSVFTALLVDLLPEPFFTLENIGITTQHLVERLGVEKCKRVVLNLITIVRANGSWLADNTSEQTVETSRHVLKTLLSLSARHPAAGITLYSGLVAYPKTTPEAVVKLLGEVLRWIVGTTRRQDSICIENLLAVLNAMLRALLPRLKVRTRTLLAAKLTPETYASIATSYDTVAVHQNINHLRAFSAQLASVPDKGAKRSRAEMEKEKEGDTLEDAAAREELKALFLQKIRDDVALRENGGAGEEQEPATPHPSQADVASQKSSQRGGGRALATPHSQRTQRATQSAKGTVLRSMKRMRLQRGVPAGDPGTEWRLLLNRIVAEGRSSEIVGIAVEWLQNNESRYVMCPPKVSPPRFFRGFFKIPGLGEVFLVFSPRGNPRFAEIQFPVRASTAFKPQPSTLHSALEVIAELLHNENCSGKLLDDPSWGALAKALLAHVEGITRRLRSPLCDGMLHTPHTTPLHPPTEITDEESYEAAAKLELLTRLVLQRACLGGMMGAGRDDAADEPTQQDATQDTASLPSQRRKRKEALPEYDEAEFAEVLKVMLTSVLPACSTKTRGKAALCKFLCAERAVHFATECVLCYLVGRRRTSIDTTSLATACLDVSPRLFPRLLQLFASCFEMQCMPQLSGTAGNDEWLDHFCETFLCTFAASCDVAHPFAEWDAWGRDDAELSRDRAWKRLGGQGLYSMHLQSFFAAVVRSSGVNRSPLRDLYSRSILTEVYRQGGSSHLCVIAADVASRFKTVLAALLESVAAVLTSAQNSGVDVTLNQATAVHALISILLAARSRPVTQLLVAFKSDVLTRVFSNHLKIVNTVRAGRASMGAATPTEHRDLFGEFDEDEEAKPRALELWDRLQALDWTVPLPKAAPVKKVKEGEAGDDVEDNTDKDARAIKGALEEIEMTQMGEEVLNSQRKLREAMFEEGDETMPA